jgi:hypothetical protein
MGNVHATRVCRWIAWPAVTLAALCAVGSWPLAAEAQDVPDESTVRAPGVESDDPALVAARAEIDRIELERFGADGQWAAARVGDRPILRFEEPTRDNRAGTVWTWGGPGRPAAIVELYQHTERAGDWCFVFNNLSGGETRASRGGKSWWEASRSDVELFFFRDAPAVADNSRVRLRQMKLLARSFESHEFWDPNHSRYELRLLAQPLQRYSDAATGLVDGALFVFANGTNPEVILLIEARREGEAAAWRYGLARFGHAEMHVALGGETVWSVPRVDPYLPPDSPYWLFYQSAVP